MEIKSCFDCNRLKAKEIKGGFKPVYVKHTCKENPNIETTFLAIPEECPLKKKKN